MQVRATMFLGVLGALAMQAASVEISDRFYEAIRNNDLETVQQLAKTGVNVRDKRGATPLMYSAVTGSAESMRMLLESGAEVNARNDFGATALMWSAADPVKVRMLLAKGADVNAKSKMGRTALMMAAATEGAFDSVKMLVDAGADVKAQDGMQSTALHAAAISNATAAMKLLLARGAAPDPADMAGLTPLMFVAANGNVEMVQVLLAKGADPNAVSAPSIAPPVKNGPVAVGKLTPLILAAVNGGPQVVRLLLDAGAQVNVQDIAGATPLIRAIATDRPSVETVKLLLAHGADPKLKSIEGDSAVDWARKYNYPPVLAALGTEKKATDQPVTMIPVVGTKNTPEMAVSKSLALIGRTTGSFFKEGGCGACHAQNVAAMALSTAHENGFPVDPAMLAMAARNAKLGWSSFEQGLLQRVDGPGGPDMTTYTIFEILSSGGEPDRTTDAMLHNLAAQQQSAGNWHFFLARPPIQDGDFSRTAMAIRSLSSFGAGGRRVEFSDRIGKAAGWLMRATPRTTEDRVMQALGLEWAGAGNGVVRGLVKDLMSLQRADGGWAQNPELASDAYATGQVLYTMHQAGIPASDPAYRRGVDFLLRTQAADGSWHVKSRVIKLQPYFQSGFPYDHDQWISAAATAWATMGLSYAASANQVAMAQ